MYENDQLVDGHRVDGTTREWESRGFYEWDVCTVLAGQIDTGQWYVRRHAHPRTGPARTEIYDSQDDALEVALAVVNHAAELLGRPFVLIDRDD